MRGLSCHRWDRLGGQAAGLSPIRRHSDETAAAALIAGMLDNRWMTPLVPVKVVPCI